MKKLFISAAFALALALPASAQVTATRIQSAITNNIACIFTTTNLANSQLITNAVKLQRHLAVGVVFNGVATNTGQLGIPFYAIYNNTNKSSLPVFTATFTATGSNVVNGYYVVPDYTLGPVDGLVAGAVTNAAANVAAAQSGSIVVSNIWIQTLQ